MTDDRRIDHARRQAITALRLAELRASTYILDDAARIALGDAINGVIALIRGESAKDQVDLGGMI